MNTIIYNEPLGPCLKADGTRYTGNVELRVTAEDAINMMRAMVVGDALTGEVHEVGHPLPVPNPGGVTAEELGEGWELFDSVEGSNRSEWFNVEERTWHREDPPCDYTMESYSRYSWRRPKKQEQPNEYLQQRKVRIDCAVDCIADNVGKRLFRELAEKFSDASVFWDPKEPEAMLTLDGFSIIISVGAPKKQDTTRDAAENLTKKKSLPAPPDPGPRHRLVDTDKEAPREDAEVWGGAEWHSRNSDEEGNPCPYFAGSFYRVPLTRRLIPPTGEELLGQKVRMGEEKWSALVTFVDDRVWSVDGGEHTRSLDHKLWMSAGLRTDPKTGEWIPYAKEVWE